MDIKTADVFQHVEIENAPEQLYRQMEEMIISGEYDTGDRLPSERKLMELFGRSHPTVREALRLLESAGYVRVVPGGGAVVNEFHKDSIEQPLAELMRFRNADIKDIYEYLGATGPQFAALAAVRCTEEDLDAFEAEARAIREEELSVPELFDRYKNFDELIAKATGNPLVYLLRRSINNNVMLTSDATITNDKEKLYKHHQKMINLIREHDAAGPAEEFAEYWRNFGEYVGHYVTYEPHKSNRSSTRVPFDVHRKPKASELIYSQIRDLIVTGKLLPGDRLPAERKMIESFGWSRPVIREALKMLEMKGYVTIKRGSGTVVNDVSTGEIQRVIGRLMRREEVSLVNVIELRAICESAMAAWAAERGTEEQFNEMQQILDESAKAETREEFMLKGLKFNGAIAYASGNEMTWIVGSMTSGLMNAEVKSSNAPFTAEEMNSILAQHQRMLDAIKAGDKMGAIRATSEHLLGDPRSVLKEYAAQFDRVK